jgi:hypothetical protein
VFDMTTEKQDGRFGVDDDATDDIRVRETPVPPAPEATAGTGGSAEEEKLTPEEVMAIVGERLAGIETVLMAVKEDVEELHDLLLGIPHPKVKSLSSKGGRIGGIGQVFHDWNQFLTVIMANSETMLANHSTYVNEVSRVHQENVAIAERLSVVERENRRLERELDRLRDIAAMKLSELSQGKDNE